LAWAFLGSMLSLSQLQFWLDSAGFQQTATPMTWAGWFRVPAVGYRSFIQHAWPAAVLMGSAHFYQYRRKVYRLAVGVAVSFLVFAALEATLQIGWSEDFRKIVSLYRFLEQFRTEFMLVSLTGIAVVAWFVNRKLWIATVAIGLWAAAALYRVATPITEGHVYTYSDDSRRFVATIPVAHNTPGLITLLFAAGCLLAALIVFRRQVTGLEVTSLVLCTPLAVDVAASLGAYWYPFGWRPFQYWPWVVLVLAGLGLVGLAWSVLRRTSAAERIPSAAQITNDG
jgi:hypothetical protein